MTNVTDFETALSHTPIIAILRGIQPGEVLSIGNALVRAGIQIIEVPLNSPAALESIRFLADELGESCVIGAGTVLSAQDVDAVISAGGRLVVTPNTDNEIISRAVEREAITVPGVATATEAFRAYRFGARYLKLFPASSYGCAHVKALLAVLPDDAKLLGVGGIGPGDIGEWMQAGICAVGMGSELYRPGDNAAAVLDKASVAVDAAKKAMAA